MPKQKYQNEDEIDDGYIDAECPECEAPIHLRFQKGRNSRRLRCRVCEKLVTIILNKAPFPQNLVQLQ